MNRADIKDPCKPTDPNRTTVSSGEVAFCYFFQREQEFAAFRPYEQAFYKHVRCGLLHQGETMSGWRVQRKEELFDVPNLTVNATKFLMAVRRSLRAYAEKC